MNFKRQECNLSYAQVCTAIRANPLADEMLIASISSVADVTMPVGYVVVPMQILVIWFLEFGRQAKASVQHPRRVLAAKVVVPGVTLMVDHVRIHYQEKEETIPLTNGFVVCEEHATAAYAADAISYMYTSAVKQGQIIKNNFSLARTAHAMPHSTKEYSRPETWVDSDAIKNADNVYAACTADVGQIAYVIQDVMMALDSVYEEGKHYIKCRPPPTYTAAKFVRYPRKFVPAMCKITQLDRMWSYMSRHRMIRSEDNKWLSPLTSGYYYASMDKSVDKVMWQIADILHITRTYELSAIYFLNAPNSTVATSLARAGYIVTIKTEKVKVDLVDGKPGVFRVRKMVTEPICTLTIAETDPCRPVVTKIKVEYKDDADRIGLMIGVITSMNSPVMTWQYMSPLLFGIEYANNAYYVFPSVHAHAGTAIVISGVKYDDALWTQEQLIMRCADANVFKTWFPFSRTRFLEFDIKKYSFLNLGFYSNRGLTIAANIQKAEQYYGPLENADNFGIVEDYVPKEGEALARMGLAVGLKPGDHDIPAIGIAGEEEQDLGNEEENEDNEGDDDPENEGDGAEEKEEEEEEDFGELQDFNVDG